MTEQRCPRLWQAEAVLDGVLSDADRASFERHLATCEACSAERAALLRLGQVAARTPSFASTALRRRALHNELLRRANEISVGERPQPKRRPRALVWAVAAALLGVTLAFALPALRGSSLGEEPRFSLTATPSSHYRVVERGRVLRLALAAGTYTLSVEKLLHGQRFLLDLPDGELEVRGTRFVVDVEGRRTRSVAVQEGRVALRLDGHREMLLGAGEAWPHVAPAEPAATTAVADRESPAAPSSGASAHAALATKQAPAQRRSGVAGLDRERVLASEAPGDGGPPPNASLPKAKPGPSASSDAPAARGSAANDFADAMAVFRQGDFGTAERLFRLFEERHPGNAHVEDVLFLRALSRSRRGDAAGARALSSEYLRRYPNGFRAAEARRMAAVP